MFRTAASVCTGEGERKESLEVAREIAVLNGYSLRKPSFRPRGRAVQENGNAPTTKIPFLVPFVSDEVSTSIRKCPRRSGLENLVAVINLPPDNLKTRLVCNRLYDRICGTPNCVVCPGEKEGDCTVTGVVYLISCQACGEEYIGETGRPLHVSIKEHLDGKEKLRASTALGYHRINSHGGEDFGVEVRILGHEVQISVRKALEAFWIYSRDPKVNRKGECLYITRELRPYLSLAF
ncbi:unnamed protein product [Heligmosomoides polygyrus]|uniref:C2H2-type domain-containing protein n=1 Tax=Heligmosomoides polygyrus TaxID=6339 RepID=A0A183G252_HELPZ|nr:unnamed protein product [Heligmosomoides polygyrus]